MLGTTLCGKRPCYIDIKSKPICDSISFNLNVFHSSKAKEIFKICAKRKDRLAVIQRDPLFVLYGRFQFLSAKDLCTIIGIDWTVDSTAFGWHRENLIHAVI